MHHCLMVSSANEFVRIPETFSSCTQSLVLTSSGNLSTILTVSSSVSGETRTPFDLQRLRVLSTSQSTPRIVQDYHGCPTFGISPETCDARVFHDQSHMLSLTRVCVCMCVLCVCMYVSMCVCMCVGMCVHTYILYNVYI